MLPAWSLIFQVKTFLRLIGGAATGLQCRIILEGIALEIKNHVD
jgi:hypothetical protein